MPILMVKERVSKELNALEDKGYKIHLKSTFNIESKKISNVLGMIPGRSDEYLFITAHLDHVGPDSDGTIHPGALDNASGVSAMLEIARYIKSQGVKPLKNIVFVAFNAEEGGLLGSYDYIVHPLYPLYKTTVLNLDMVGTNRKIPLTIAYNTTNYRNSDPSLKLRDTLKKLGEVSNLDVNEKPNEASDHTIFTYFNVPAVTLIDYDLSKIHTPQDSIDSIGKKNLGRALKLVMGYVALNAYSNYSINGFSIVRQEFIDFAKAQYPLFVVLILAVFSCLMLSKKNKGKENLKSKRIPVFSLIITIMFIGIISYFPLNSQSVTLSLSGAIDLLKYGFTSILKSLILAPYYVLFMVPGAVALFIANSRIHSWKYNGDGKEYNVVYKISMISVIIASFYFAIMYSTPLYLSLTPVFARSFISKIVLNVVFALISFGIYKLFCLEINIKAKGYKNLIAFSLIFFILLSSFYAPIFINKNTFNANSSVNVSDFSGDPSDNQ